MVKIQTESQVLKDALVRIQKLENQMAKQIGAIAGLRTIADIGIWPGGVITGPTIFKSLVQISDEWETLEYNQFLQKMRRTATNEPTDHPFEDRLAELRFSDLETGNFLNLFPFLMAHDETDLHPTQGDCEAAGGRWEGGRCYIDTPWLVCDQGFAGRKDIYTLGMVVVGEGVLNLYGGVGWGPEGFNSNPFIWLGRGGIYGPKDALEVRLVDGDEEGSWWSFGELYAGDAEFFNVNPNIRDIHKDEDDVGGLGEPDNPWKGLCTKALYLCALEENESDVWHVGELEVGFTQVEEDLIVYLYPANNVGLGAANNPFYFINTQTLFTDVLMGLTEDTDLHIAPTGDNIVVIGAKNFIPENNNAGNLGICDYETPENNKVWGSIAGTYVFTDNLKKLDGEDWEFEAFDQSLNTDDEVQFKQLIIGILEDNKNVSLIHDGDHGYLISHFGSLMLGSAADIVAIQGSLYVDDIKDLEGEPYDFNPFDQDLNTNDDVRFSHLRVGVLAEDKNISMIFDGDHGYITSHHGSLMLGSASDIVAIQGDLYVSGIKDLEGNPYSFYDQDLNTDDEVMFSHIRIGALEDDKNVSLVHDGSHGYITSHFGSLMLGSAADIVAVPCDFLVDTMKNIEGEPYIWALANMPRGDSGKVLTAQGSETPPTWEDPTVGNVQKGSNSTDASGEATVSFSPAFASAPTVVATPVSSSGEVSLTIYDISASSFKVKTKSSGNHKHYLGVISAASSADSSPTTLTNLGSKTSGTPSASVTVVTSVNTSTGTPSTTTSVAGSHTHAYATTTGTPSADVDVAPNHTHAYASTTATPSATTTVVTSVSTTTGSPSSTTSVAPSHTHAYSSTTGSPSATTTVVTEVLNASGDFGHFVGGYTDYADGYGSHRHGFADMNGVTGGHSVNTSSVASSGHTHNFSSVTGYQEESLVSVASSGHTHSVSRSTGSVASSTHTHNFSSVTGYQEENLVSAATGSHTHNFSSVTGYQEEDLASVASSTHTHSVTRSTGSAASATHTHSTTIGSHSHYIVGRWRALMLKDSAGNDVICGALHYDDEVSQQSLYTDEASLNNIGVSFNWIAIA